MSEITVRVLLIAGVLVISRELDFGLVLTISEITV